MRATLCLTLDLDGPGEYAALHGLKADCDPLVMFAAPLTRFADFCRELSSPATLFVVARDLNSQTAARLAELQAQGFEIASHSFAHAYQLSRRPLTEIRNDFEQARDAFAKAGFKPCGFRAPGYQGSKALHQALHESGFRYDSSLFSSPSYYVAKAAVLAYYRLRGRQSSSLLGSPVTQFRDRAPHLLKDPGTLEQGSLLWELPINTVGFGRWPITGAMMAMLPDKILDYASRSLGAQKFIVLNFHAMDFVAAETDGLSQSLVRRQPELRIAISTRLQKYNRFVAALKLNHSTASCAKLALALAENFSDSPTLSSGSS